MIRTSRFDLFSNTLMACWRSSISIVASADDSLQCVSEDLQQRSLGFRLAHSLDRHGFMRSGLGLKVKVGSEWTCMEQVETFGALQALGFESPDDWWCATSFLNWELCVLTSNELVGSKHKPYNYRHSTLDSWTAFKTWFRI